MRTSSTRFETRVSSSGQKNTQERIGKKDRGYAERTLQQGRWPRGRESSKAPFSDSSSDDESTGDPLFAKGGPRTLPEKLYILVSCVIGPVVRLIYALTSVGPGMKRCARPRGSRNCSYIFDRTAESSSGGSVLRARGRKVEKSLSNQTVTSPMGPLRCFPTMISASPFLGLSSLLL